MPACDAAAGADNVRRSVQPVGAVTLHRPVAARPSRHHSMRAYAAVSSGPIRHVASRRRCRSSCGLPSIAVRGTNLSDVITANASADRHLSSTPAASSPEHRVNYDVSGAYGTVEPAPSLAEREGC
jgi:hypothetical protein